VEENQGQDFALLINETTEKDKYRQAPNSVDIHSVEHPPLLAETSPRPMSSCHILRHSAPR